MAISNASKDRYPGIKAFEKSQASLFKGRDQEIQELFSLIMAENCVVLFAKSGLGKSSLLNAGVSPFLEQKGYIPINVRLQVTGEQKTPVTLLKTSLQQFAFSTNIESITTDTDLEKICLWEYIKSCQFPFEFTPVLIFDQFEEFFSNKVIHQLEFLKQIAEIMHHEPPVRILDWYKNIPVDKRTNEQINWCSQPRIKILIGIREDRIGELSNLAWIIPNILRCTYKLNPLEVDKAREAIEMPASSQDSQFAIRPFRYEKNALDTIINKLSEGKRYVESTQLQIVCHQIEKKVKEIEKDLTDDQKVEVTADFFGGKAGIEDMIKNFYYRQVDTFTAGLQRDNIKDLLEMYLVQNGRRVLLYENQVIDYLLDNHNKLKAAIKQNVNPPGQVEKMERGDAYKMIENLLELRLIRGDFREDDKLYEISHDTLVNPITAAILERKLKAEKECFEREQEKIKKDTAEQKAWRDAEKRRANEQQELKELAEKARREAEKALKVATAYSENAKAAKEEAIAAKEEALAASEKAKIAKEEADRARIKARRRSIAIFILGFIMLVISGIAGYIVTKQRKDNIDLLCGVLVGKAGDELNNFRNYVAFDHLYVADQLSKDAETAPLYTKLNNQVLTGRSIQSVANGNRIAVQGADSSLFIWDISRYPIRLIKKFNGVTKYVISPLGNKALLLKDSGYATVWDLDRNDTMKGISNVKLHWSSNIKFSQNGQSLLVSDHNRNVRVFKAEGDSLFLYKNDVLYKLLEKEKNISRFGGLRYRILFTPDGQNLAYLTTPTDDISSMYSFSLKDEKSFTRLIKNVWRVFFNEDDFLNGDRFIYSTPDKTFYTFNISDNNIDKSIILTEIYRKYYKDSFFSKQSSNSDIACNYLNSDDLNAVNFITRLINFKTGKIVTSFITRNDGFWGPLVKLYGTCFSYLDTNQRIVFQKYTDTVPFFRTDSVYVERGLPCFVSPSERYLVYLRKDTLFVRDIQGDSIVRKIYSPGTSSIAGINNDFFIANTTYDRIVGKLISYNLFTKEQLRKIYPDSTAAVREHYDLKY